MYELQGPSEQVKRRQGSPAPAHEWSIGSFSIVPERILYFYNHRNQNLIQRDEPFYSKLIEGFKIALSSIGANKTRAMLTTNCLVVRIVSVTALNSLFDGLRR